MCFLDDRVRAIATAMGLTTSIWTATPGGQKFDTNGSYHYPFPVILFANSIIRLAC
jgi:hypothetical protein